MSSRGAAAEASMAKTAGNSAGVVSVSRLGAGDVNTPFGDARLKALLASAKARSKEWRDAVAAIDEVFKDPKVKEIGGKMREEVVKLNAAAKSGDIAAIRAQFGETGKSCKACHDNFRKD